MSDWDEKIGFTRTLEEVNSKFQIKQKIESLSRNLNEKTTTVSLLLIGSLLERLRLKSRE